MSNVTTFGAFNVARLGIYVSSRALDIVGNNIANINTVGYTRQRANVDSLYLGGSDRYVSKMDQRIGQGAFTSRISQLRDPYLDIRYRNETTKVSEAEEKLNILDELSMIIDEVAMGNDDDNEGKGVLEAQFSDLITQMNNLVTQGSGQDIYDSLVRESAESLCGIIRKKANDLEELRERQETKFYEETLPEVNSILSQIQDLTSSIRKSQIHGGDALELRDRRNTLIDQLSGFMKIEVTYDEEDVGDGLMVERLNIRQPESDGYLLRGVYASKIEEDPAASYPMGLKLAPLKNLRGEVLRGYEAEVPIKDDALTGSLQADREMLTEKGEYAWLSDVEYDKQAGVKRGIPYYQEALNTLASEFARVMNEANKRPELEGVEWYKGGALFSNDSNGDDDTGIDAFNISVSLSWKSGQTRIVKSTDREAGSTATDNYEHILALLTKKHEFGSGTDREKVDPYFTGSFQEMYSNNISGILGMDIQTTERMLANYTQLQDDIYVKRESVSGVDLNDEAANMMQYQKSYAAACRLMTTIDEVLDKLINGTAV